MSLSSTNSTIPSPVVPSKRRRAAANQPPPQPPMDDSPSASSTAPGHIPKRGARACTACRKGKNRCEGEVSGLSAPCRPPSRSPYRVARLYRPGPETNKIGSLSSLPTERPALRIRETREEKRPAAIHRQCRVRTRSPLFCLPFLTLFSSCLIDVYPASKASM
jgi:hypothetical protein